MKLSHIALILVLAPWMLLAAAGCGGGGGSSTVAADATPSSDLNIVAKGLKFDRKALVAVASAPTTVTLDNKDGVAHNFALYSDKTAATVNFRGDVHSDRKAQAYTFTSPSAGTYYFRCDVHPDMNGSFIVQ